MLIEVIRKTLAVAVLLVAALGPARAVPVTEQPEPLPSILPQPEDLERIGALPPEVLGQLREDAGTALRARGLALKRRLDQKPNDRFVMHALATVMYLEGTMKLAQDLWAAAHKGEPNLPSAPLMTAVQDMYLALAAGDHEKARTQLAAIENEFGQDPHFHLLRAEQAMRSRNVDAAERAYRKAYTLAPHLYVTALNLGRFVEAVRNDDAGAARLYQEAAGLAPGRPEAWTHLAALQVRQNQLDAALESLRKVTALDPTAAMPERRIADWSTALGRHEDATRWYRAALAKAPSDTEALSIRVGLGNALLRQQRYAEARREIESVLAVQHLPPLVFALATVDEAEGKFESAEQRYRAMLEATPGHALAANNLAMLLVRTGKAQAEALSLAEQARAALPNNAIIEGTWGCALVENGRGAEAVDILRAVTKAQPDGDAWTHYCLGKALANGDAREEASMHLHKALALDTAFPRRPEITRLIDALQ